MKTQLNSISVNDFRLIDLNDLPKFSPWPSRLLGLSSFKQVLRSNDYSLREYEKKFSDILQSYNNQKFTSLFEALGFINTKLQPSYLFIFDEKIYFTENNSMFWSFIYSEIIKVLGLYLKLDDTLVELGCGWGRNLFNNLYMKQCKSMP